MDTQGSVGDFSAATQANYEFESASGSEQARRQPTFKLTPRLEADYLLGKASEQEKDELCRKLSSAIIYFIGLNRSVYLPSLGILYPVLTTRNRPYPLNSSRLAIRTEEVRSIEFEKCDDPGEHQRKKHGDYIDFFELSEKVFNSLELPFQLRINRQELRALIKGIVNLIRQEVVVNGRCDRLAPFLTFYSLHNRQGDSTADWFAGADIFIETNHKELVTTSEAQEVERVIFESPFEPFEVICHSRPKIYPLVPEVNLSRLGFGQFKHVEKTENELQFAIYPFFTEKTGKKQFLIVSDGFRSFAREGETGTEVTCIVQSNLDTNEIRTVAETLLSLAWALLTSRDSGALEAGCGISFDSSAFREFDISALFVVKSLHFGVPQLLADGEFRYVHLTGLTADEESLLSSCGKAHLEALLRRKGLLRAILPNRSSALSKTSWTDIG